ncbi:MAG: site-specific integrase [Acidimicrobiales bacterium]
MSLAERDDPEWATFLRLSAATGRRRGELCALAWDAVDLEDATITIRRAIEIVPGGIHVRESPKSAAGVRQIALDAVTAAALRAQRVQASEVALACGVSLGRRAFVFSGDPAGAQPWHPNHVTRKFISLRRAAGLGDTVRLHDFRHYVGSQLVAAGYDPVSIAGRLGHDPKVLLSTYAHWMPARDKDQADFLGRLLDGPVRPG